MTPPSRSYVTTAIWIALVIAPPLFLFYLILQYSVNVPFYDQWEIARLFPKLADGSLSFADLFAQHNEHRILFPRILFLSLGTLTGWDVRYEMVCSLLLVGIFSVSLYRVNRATSPRNQNYVSGTFLLANLIIFSPIQSENWLWGFQFSLFVPMTCLAAVLALSVSSLGDFPKWMIAMCLATVATFSYANGLVLWILALPSLLMSDRHRVRQPNWLLFLWIVTAVLAIFAYFYGYTEPGHHPSMRDVFYHPVLSLKYFIALLGTPIALGFSNRLLAAVVLGAFCFTCFMTAAIYVFFSRSDRSFLQNCVPWLSLGFYSLFSAAIITVGRAGFGVDQALSLRYIAFSINLIVAIVFMVPIVVRHCVKTSRFQIDGILCAQVTAAIATFLFISYITALPTALNSMKHLRRSFLEMKAELQLMPVLPVLNAFDRLYLSQRVREVAPQLSQLGKLHPPLLTSTNLNNIAGGTKGGGGYGFFDTLRREANDLVATGWAILPHRQECADVVVLACEESDQPTMIAMAESGILRPDLVTALSSSRYDTAGWQRRFSASLLPKPCEHLSAWAFDAENGRAYKLQGDLPVPEKKI